jgi:hypothetical protein
MRGMLSLLFMVPAIASAGGGLQNVERLFGEMEYEEVLEVVERALTSAGMGPEDLVAVYWWKGLSLSSLGRLQEAVTAFVELLSIDPSFSIPEDDVYSPRQLLPFYRAVKVSGEMGHEPIGLSHTPTKRVGAAAVLALEVLVRADPVGMIQGVVLRYRGEEAGEERHVAVPVEGPGVVRVNLPVGLGGGDLYYHFEAVNGHGGVLARCGSRDDPFCLKAVAEIAAPAEDGESALSTWGWGASGVGGALLAGGAVCGGLALSLDGDLSESCSGGGCPAGRAGDLDRLDALVFSTDVLLGAGTAVLLVGVVLLFLDGGGGAPMGAEGSVSVSVVPSAGEGAFGASVMGRFW